MNPLLTATSIGICAIVSLLTCGCAPRHVGIAPTTKPKTIRVAVCQTLCIDSDRTGNLRRIAYALESAATQGAQLACFPETADLGWINPASHELAHPIPGPTTDQLARLAQAHHIMIAIGLCEKVGDKLYDSAVLIGTDGEILLKHRKINTLDELFSPPYGRGTLESINAVDTPLGRIGLLICADTFIGEILARMVTEKPDLLVVPYGWAANNDEWPVHGQNLAQLVASVAQRIGCPVIGTDLVGAISAGPWQGKTYGGQSIVVDAGGNTLGILRDRDVDLRVFDVHLQR